MYFIDIKVEFLLEIKKKNSLWNNNTNYNIKDNNINRKKNC